MFSIFKVADSCILHTLVMLPWWWSQKQWKHVGNYNMWWNTFYSYAFVDLFYISENSRWLLHQRIYLLTPWCRVLLEKRTGFQLVKKFPAFYGTRMFITAITSSRPRFLTWARSIKPIPSIPLSEDPSEYYPPIYAWVSQVVSFLAPMDLPPLSYMELVQTFGT